MCPCKAKQEIDFLDYEAIRDATKYLTVARVVHYLTYIFDSGTHEIVRNGLPTTPVELASHPAQAQQPAASVEILFWGGPPEQAEWFRGDLLTLLIDNIFYCAAMEFDDVVRKFLEALGGSNKTRQLKFEAFVST